MTKPSSPNKVDPAVSKRMKAVRTSGTKPELRVRKLLHSNGFRYRLHSRKLPGKPDIVFGSKKKVIFVHGCFWHSHTNCKYSGLPKTNVGFWKPKLAQNVERDQKVLAQLDKMGWKSLVIWECETRSLDTVSGKLNMFLGNSS